MARQKQTRRAQRKEEIEEHWQIKALKDKIGKLEAEVAHLEYERAAGLERPLERQIERGGPSAALPDGEPRRSALIEITRLIRLHYELIDADRIQTEQKLDSLLSQLTAARQENRVPYFAAALSMLDDHLEETQVDAINALASRPLDDARPAVWAAQMLDLARELSHLNGRRLSACAAITWAIHMANYGPVVCDEIVRRLQAGKEIRRTVERLDLEWARQHITAGRGITHAALTEALEHAWRYERDYRRLRPGSSRLGGGYARYEADHHVGNEALKLYCRYLHNLQRLAGIAPQEVLDLLTLPD